MSRVGGTLEQSIGHGAGEKRLLLLYKIRCPNKSLRQQRQGSAPLMEP